MNWSIVKSNNLFKISTTGKIVKLPHVVYYKNGRHKNITTEKEVPLYLDSTGYLSCGALRKRVHYLLVENFIADIPDGYVVDHIDGNKLNNDLSNLQVIKNSHNTRRSRKIAGCYYRKDRKKWAAVINIDNKRTYLGHYDSKDQATQAYYDATKKYNIKYE
jgi:hypothetical protein